MDRVLRYALLAAQEAVGHADLDVDATDRNRTMVAIGSGVGGIETLFANQKILEPKGAHLVSSRRSVLDREHAGRRGRRAIRPRRSEPLALGRVHDEHARDR